MSFEVSFNQNKVFEIFKSSYALDNILNFSSPSSLENCLVLS